MKSYQQDVVSQRNMLGHSVLLPNGKPNSVVDDTGKVVDITQMRDLRKRILGLRAEFRTLLKDMQAATSTSA